MKKYEFSYKDNEGDLFESGELNSKEEVRAEMKKLNERYDGDFEIVETWIYTDGEYTGSF